MGSESSTTELYVVEVRVDKRKFDLSDDDSSYCSATAPGASITNELVLLLLLALPVVSVAVTIVIIYLLTHKGSLWSSLIF